MSDAPETPQAPTPGDTAAGSSETGEASLRADKWLWFARFFKSRNLAADLCKAGKLRVSGTKVAKASHPVRPGDVLTFPKGRHVRVVKVLALGLRRGPAAEAATLYEDLDPPQAAGSPPPAPEGAPPGANRPPGAGRPTKRERRELDRLTGKDGGDG